MNDFQSQFVDPLRIHVLKDNKSIQDKKCVLYNMFSEQRAHDNYALIYAAELANHLNVPLATCHVIQKSIKNRTFARHYYFSIVGMEQTDKELRKQNIMHFELKGNIIQEVSELAKKIDAAVLVFDFIPLQEPIKWQKSIARKLQCNVYQIECQTLPIRLAKKEPYLPVNIRKLAYDNYPKYLKEFPKLPKIPKWNLEYKQDSFDYENEIREIINDKKMMKVPPVFEFVPGKKAGLEQMHDFFTNKDRFQKYHLSTDYGFPERQSRLNPYLKFGQISEQSVFFELQKYKKYKEPYNRYFEELYRRYFNYTQCYYNPKYNIFDGLWDWSKRELNNHRQDQREHIYTLQQLINSKTDSEFWNNLQSWQKHLSMLPGFVRQIWASQIVLWTKDPETALKYIYYINDVYTLDGFSAGHINCSYPLGLGDKMFYKNYPIKGRIRPMSLQRTQDQKGDYERFKQILQSNLQKQYEWLEELKKKYKKN